MSEGYKIATGWNVGSGSLTDIETIVVSGQRFAGPKVTPLYDPGGRKYRTDGSVFNSGFSAITWRFGILYYQQWKYLRDTYCAGGFSGKVTILSDTGDAVFARWNAVLQLPFPNALKGSMTWYKDADITMARIVASS